MQKVRESKENYLEAIYMLSKKLPHVRAVDVARKLDFSKASVSVALSNLKQDDLVIVDDLNCLHLTGEGRALAERIYERHVVLIDFFISLGVDPETAEEDACRIEHVISPVTFEKLKDFIARVPKENWPNG